MSSGHDPWLSDWLSDGGEESWGEIAAREAGKRSDCPYDGDLIELAMGQATAADADRLNTHLADCSYCRASYEAYCRGLEHRQTPPPHLAEGVVLDNPTPPDSNSHFAALVTGLITTVLEGRSDDALQLLRQCLPDILSALNANPALADDLAQQILDLVKNGNPQSRRSVLDALSQSVREGPAPTNLEPVLTNAVESSLLRVALEKGQDGESASQRHLREEGLRSLKDRRLMSLNDWLRLSQNASSQDQPYCRKVTAKVEKQRNDLMSLVFGHMSA
jgi:hypothetical protein